MLAFASRERVCSDTDQNDLVAALSSVGTVTEVIWLEGRTYGAFAGPAPHGVWLAGAKRAEPRRHSGLAWC